MFEDVLVAANLFAPAFPIAALKLNLSQQVPRDAVHLIKLRVASAKRTVVRIFCKPVAFAICANRFFANFTF
jgi:hypothetical protein